MKFKRIIAAIIASAAIVGTSALTSFAAEDGEASYCFDTPDKMSDWLTSGSSVETGLTMTHTTLRSKNGDGSIIVSENSSEAIQNGTGGAYINAETVGLENFAGCTVTMSVMLCDGAEGFYDNLAIYSDGMIMLRTAVPTLSTKEWTDVSLTLPENASNSMVGFTIPTFSAYSGDIVYIDDFTITRPDGTTVANLGDYKQKTILSENTVSKGKNIALTIVLVVLILAIVGGIGLIISAIMKKFA